MKFLENIKLSEHTTFRIGGPAKYFVEVITLNDILEALAFSEKKQLPVLALSGGSNVLVSDQGFDGLVLKLGIKGVEKIIENNEEVVLKLGSGEIWDQVVAFAVECGLWGIENLSHIPGRVGGFAVQNVGAYGQEAKDVVVSVDAYDTIEKRLVTLDNKTCGFGYRKSIFNTSKRGRYIILFTRIRLLKNGKPNLSYVDLSQVMEAKEVNLKNIRDSIIQIRNRKFPFPISAETGNSGSWFKNIFLNNTELKLFKNRIMSTFGHEAQERLQSYENRFKLPEGVKIPAAFLLDICGLKGLSFGGAIINPNQPLVIVNSSGHATASDVLQIVRTVKSEVFTKTGINLLIEPELIGFKSKELEGVV